MSKCLLFDCDGTLVDSETLAGEAMAQAIAAYGVELDAVAYTQQYKGLKFSNILQALQSHYKLSFAADFESSYRARLASLFAARLQPIKYIKEALQSLPQAKAVVSSGPPEKIALSLKVSELAPFFGNNIFSSYEVGVFKPDPEIYRHAARSMGYDYEDCAVIDDSAVGVEAGVKAGMRTFFYNVYAEPCAFTEAVSFDSMRNLPALISAA